MRGLVSMFNMFAVTNFFAMVVLLGWLIASHRLDGSRVEGLRSLFAVPVYVEEARARAEAEAEAAEAEASRVAGMAGTLPITAEQRLAIIREGEELTRQQNERIQRETRDLLETLARERASLDERIALFEADRSAFETMRAEVTERETSEQFRQTLKVLEGMRADEASELLDALIEGGKRSEAVSYLDAMSTRSASKVLGEIRDRDAVLAADLLERMRVYGIEADPG